MHHMVVVVMQYSSFLFSLVESVSLTPYILRCSLNTFNLVHNNRHGLGNDLVSTSPYILHLVLGPLGYQTLVG